ncbi:MAG TPA: hypothetical protein VFQ96_01240 [Microbacteriaceae bacterium]|nr:hypothetical protein [Microbacteriaceae bacterium]
MDPATRRLMFWLKAPYLVDVALGLVGAALLAAGRAAGWWVILFGAGRAALATAALIWLTPRLRRRSAPGSGAGAARQVTSRRGRRPWRPSRRRT